MKYNFVKITTFLSFIFLFCNISNAQGYWQQRVNYEISIDFNSRSHQYTGEQTLKYYNNSPDTLFNVYYHLYFNAFQPNSMMDVRSRTLPDPDARVGSRIAELSQDEIGYLKVISLNQSGMELTHHVSETVLEVKLSKPILPGASEVFNMKFEGQVPLQIRRSGRDSFEGVDYSMSQWFPKMAEYDKMGWHTHPYIAREFYAPWGDYEVNITMDKDYVIAATGILQNPNEIGYGYEDEGVEVNRKGQKITWRFKAENVHDFVWAADKDYIQTTAQVPDGPLLRFFYIPGEPTKHWEELPSYTIRAFEYIQKRFGKYGWSEYAVIQGGDGGMEYPMATLIANKKTSGVRSLNSLISVMIHEVAHSWYQGMLATNESYFPWMDEGFASFADEYTEDFVLNRSRKQPLASLYKTYFRWVETGYEEPLSTHSDHYTRNNGYSIGAYKKGAISLEQLGYIIGEANRDAGLLRYYNEWAFKHPDMNDFIRVMEKQSGLSLRWYYDYWVSTTETIDYAISSVTETRKGVNVDLERLNKMPMPIDLTITRKDGTALEYYIPLGIMRGEKPNETTNERLVGQDWAWTHPTYSFSLDIPYADIEKIEIDPSGRMADVDKSNNLIILSSPQENTSKRFSE